MNIMQRIKCWYRKYHVLATYFDASGTRKRKCVCCGKVVR